MTLEDAVDVLGAGRGLGADAEAVLAELDEAGEAVELRLLQDPLQGDLKTQNMTLLSNISC